MSSYLSNDDLRDWIIEFGEINGLSRQTSSGKLRERLVLFGAKGDKHRYLLSGRWEAPRPPLLFIGMNPSRANENRTDPTTAWVEFVSARWGLGPFILINACPIVAADPVKVEQHKTGGGGTCSDSINDELISKLCDRVKHVVAGWGNSGPSFNYRISELVDRSDIFCLCETRFGNPRHPSRTDRAFVTASPHTFYLYDCCRRKCRF